MNGRIANSSCWNWTLYLYIDLFDWIPITSSQKEQKFPTNISWVVVVCLNPETCSESEMVKERRKQTKSMVLFLCCCIDYGINLSPPASLKQVHPTVEELSLKMPQMRDPSLEWPESPCGWIVRASAPDPARIYIYIYDRSKIHELWNSQSINNILWIISWFIDWFDSLI